jgi:hypothetical protein
MSVQFFEPKNDFALAGKIQKIHGRKSALYFGRCGDTESELVLAAPASAVALKWFSNQRSSVEGNATRLPLRAGNARSTKIRGNTRPLNWLTPPGAAPILKVRICRMGNGVSAWWWNREARYAR